MGFHTGSFYVPINFSYQNFFIGLYSECTKRPQVNCNSNTGKRIRGKDEGRALIVLLCRLHCTSRGPNICTYEYGNEALWVGR